MVSRWLVGAMIISIIALMTSGYWLARCVFSIINKKTGEVYLDKDDFPELTLIGSCVISVILAFIAVI